MALRAEWTKVTPAMAIEYLSHAAPNRTIRKKIVEGYARDMSAGKWLATGEALLLTAGGELLDGQHRLAAVIESGQTIEFLIVRGVKPDAIRVVDSGVARIFADALVIEGRTSAGLASCLGALTRRSLLWDMGIHMQGGQTMFLSHSELMDYFEAHPELEDYARFAAGSRNHPPGISATPFAFIYKLCSEVDADKGLEFCCRWRDGVSLVADSPILALRDRLMSVTLTDLAVSSDSRRTDVKIALALFAWRAYQEGRPLTKLQLPRGGLTNKTFPVPK